ncbi:hypothetical protein BOTBODRAFT_56931 [Botryobasidium botryosum FD-172 SS1]|uniref:NCS1 nucleoside transporter family n=1 Tax=Botryobasidium botryosum (strain FD-172 SS1) TaxID=930990 RepID=A0A067MKJ0_BOTB1|nr:hypothetical protein BOTBODRAFT_56931 [Botryobasidium botryosum FD-172 SS1]
MALSLRMRIAKLAERKTWELDPDPSTFAPNNKWSNKDMDPTPPDQRTWTTWSYLTLWVTDAFGVSTWEIASASMTLGLSWRQVLPAVALGYTLIGLAITANGTIGSRLRVPFPVLNRASFGFYFSYFAIVSRLILALFWFSIQSFTASEAIYQMIKAIWPSFARFPNHIPESANITSSGMLCYFIFWIIQFPFMFIPPQRIRWLFYVKSIVVPIAFISMMIWALVKTQGGGPIFAQRSSLSGSRLAFTWLAAVNNALGNYATMAVNIPDLTRYARSPRDQYVQLIIIPVAFTFVAFIGMTVTSAGKTLYGGAYLWDPLRLIDKWDNRGAAFFASFSFLLATLASNISNNSISAGNDLAALMPRYLNIRRGQILCAIIGGWALCPWEILANATGFLKFINGYTVFLSPICAIMVTDYWIVQRGRVEVSELYQPYGYYRYTKGINWRALLAVLVSVPPNMPGFIHSINPAVNIGAGANMYSLAYIIGFVLAGATYALASYSFPPRYTSAVAPILSSPGEDFDAKYGVSPA